MAYKSRKLKKRYFKRRQSRKRMYGGDIPGFGSMPAPMPAPMPIHENSQPTIMGNIKDIGNLGVSLATNVAASGIKKVAEYTGLDPNVSITENVKEVGNKMGDVVEALNSPEGEKLKEETGELLKDGLEVLEPSLQKGEEILINGAEKLAKTGTSIVVTALNELPPVFLASELSKLATAGVQAAETVAELTTIGAEASKKLEVEKEPATSLLGKARDLIANVTQKGVQYAQNRVNKYGENIVGDPLQKYQKEKMMIGGRINKAQSEFLSPYVNISQINGGKRKTKRRRKYI